MSSETDPESGRCPHLAAILDNHTESVALLSRYEAAVKWHAHRAHEFAYPAKRRKASPLGHLGPTPADKRNFSLFRSPRQNAASASSRCRDLTPAYIVRLPAVGRINTSSSTSKRLGMISVSNSETAQLGLVSSSPLNL